MSCSLSPKKFDIAGSPTYRRLLVVGRQIVEYLVDTYADHSTLRRRHTIHYELNALSNEHKTPVSLWTSQIPYTYDSLRPPTVCLLHKPASPSMPQYNWTGSQASFSPPLFRQTFTPPPPTSSHKRTPSIMVNPKISNRLSIHHKWLYHPLLQSKVIYIKPIQNNFDCWWETDGTAEPYDIPHSAVSGNIQSSLP